MVSAAQSYLNEERTPQNINLLAISSKAPLYSNNKHRGYYQTNIHTKI
jgi:hypothetical protein